ncbi:RNA-splicing factor [Batrachochytrium dendrobatidis]|nr:RNA-splicing factor [Batrachochytrium dendrobatidis]KAK5665324.1 RNA-splicing factor [Batrachochytrium dendrobatidis]
MDNTGSIDDDAGQTTVLFKKGSRSASSKNSLRSKRSRISTDDALEPSNHDDDPQPTSTPAVVSSSQLLKRKKEKLASSSFFSTVSTATSARSWDTSSIKPDPTSSALQQRKETLALELAFKSSGTAASLSKDTATRVLDVDGGSESNRPDESPAAPLIYAGDEAELTSQIYKGQSAYTEYVNKKTERVTQSNAGGIRAGPLRGQTNVRISSRFDYQPDICKDYKDTGYCGYGDSCKFMHDRGDYKAGWQIDREWDEQQKNKLANLDPNRFLITSDDEGDDDTSKNPKDEDEDLSHLPFACLICRGPFKSPVVTKCSHYFCEACALKHYVKTAKCFACNAATGGVFNVAKDLLEKLKTHQGKVAAREAKIRESNKELENDALDDGEQSDG